MTGGQLVKHLRRWVDRATRLGGQWEVLPHILESDRRAREVWRTRVRPSRATS